MKPLSVGNVVSAGLRIYRDNFKKYFKVAFIGYLWIFVPVYGWAKYSAMMGVIARLAYGEVAEQPESVKEAQRRVKPRMWGFLVTGILVSLIIFGAISLFSVAVGVLSFAANSIFKANFLNVLILIGAVILFVIGYIRLISRLFLTELPLAIEERVTATSTISQSWDLTKGAVGRIQLVVLLGFLISIPILFVTNISSFIIQVIIGIVSENIPSLAIVGGILYILLALAGGALMIPFWQAIKAVIYYDLKIRRQGMGLDLRK